MRLIDADAFKEHWNKEYRMLFPSDKYLVALSNFPAIDPSTLRPKGEWIIEIIDKEKREISVSCSECEAFFSLNSFDFGLCYNFCPTCGADMRGENK